MQRRLLKISRILLGSWLALTSFGAQPLTAAGAALRSGSGVGAQGSMSALSGASLSAATLQTPLLPGGISAPLKLSAPSGMPEVRGLHLSVGPALSAQTQASAQAFAASPHAAATGNSGTPSAEGHAAVAASVAGPQLQAQAQNAKSRFGRVAPSGSGADASAAPTERTVNAKPAAQGLKKLSRTPGLSGAMFDGDARGRADEAAAPVAAAGGSLRRSLLKRATPALAAGAAVLAFPSAALAHGAHESAGPAPYDGLTLPAVVASLLAFEGAVWLVKKTWSRWGASAVGLFNSAKKKAEAAMSQPEHHEHEHEHEGVSGRNMLMAIGVTAAYMAVEFWGAFAFNSLALKSDAVHMLWHTVALVLGAVGMALAYRHAKSNNDGQSRGALWVALVNGGLLGAMAVGIFINAVFRLMDPQIIGGLQVTVIGAGGLLVNFIGAWLLRGGHEHDANAEAMFWHNVGDIVGSLVAIAAGLAVMFNPMLAWLDPLLSLIVSRWLMATAWGIVTKNARRIKAG